MGLRGKIPSFVTSVNLCLGCLAVVFSFQEDGLLAVPFLVFSAAFADFLDGFLARKLRATSDFGMELDSLADMVTFGVVPGIILYHLLENAYLQIGITTTVWHLLPAFLVTTFSALRLAKFNTDERQKESFIGLATPACTIFIASLILIKHENSWGLASLIQNIYFLYGIIILVSYLLVAEISMFSLKVKYWGWRGNGIRYTFLFLSSLLIILFDYVGIALSIVLYVLLSLVHNIVFVSKPSQL